MGPALLLLGSERLFFTLASDHASEGRRRPPAGVVRILPAGPLKSAELLTFPASASRRLRAAPRNPLGNRALARNGSEIANHTIGVEGLQDAETPTSWMRSTGLSRAEQGCSEHDHLPAPGRVCRVPGTCSGSDRSVRRPGSHLCRHAESPAPGGLSHDGSRIVCLHAPARCSPRAAMARPARKPRKRRGIPEPIQSDWGAVRWPLPEVVQIRRAEPDPCGPGRQGRRLALEQRVANGIVSRPAGAVRMACIEAGRLAVVTE